MLSLVHYIKDYQLCCSGYVMGDITKEYPHSVDLEATLVDISGGTEFGGVFNILVSDWLDSKEVNKISKHAEYFIQATYGVCFYVKDVRIISVNTR